MCLLSPTNGNVIDSNELQPENAPCEIIVTLFGMTNSFKFLYLTLSIVIVSPVFV